MKKFLFTLAALLMAGSMVAENYLYMEDFEVSQELLAQTAGKNRRMDIPLKAHFDNRVSAFTVTLTLPEGVDLKNAVAGPDLNINTLDAVGNPKVVVNDVNFSAADSKIIVACVTAGYYYPEGADPDEDDPVTCLAAKWEPGDYDCMVTVTLQFAQEFTGGDLIVKTEPASGQDPRGNTCPKNEVWEKTCVITVEGGTVEPEVTEKPVITWEANDETQEVVITVTGAGELVLYNDDVEVARGESPLTYTVPYTDDPEGEEMGFSATAQEEGKEVSEYALATVEVPGKTPVAPEVTEAPVITYDEETFTVSATGAGEVKLYVNGEEVENPYTFELGEEETTYTVTATAKEEGKEISETATLEVTVPGKAEPQPYETPAPEVVETMTDDALMITATGEGTVTIYVQTIDNETGEMTTETYEGEGTVSAVVPRGEETYYINYWAVAQANEDAEPGSTQVSYFVEVPAKEVTPVDPSHEQGVWIVTFLAGGEEFWQEMLPSNEDYTCIVRFSYGNYGTFPYDPNKSMAENDAMRPDMPFYIVIDGVRYGAAEDGTLCVLGTALSNELFENENLYVLEHALGRVYNMGVAIDELDPSKKYVYAAVAAYTEVEEMNASKTVAGVRYFNMAGQEMQEANGMTIVVTTYTDGTTSAVKVMK